jgi:hypothetical protein
MWAVRTDQMLAASGRQAGWAALIRRECLHPREFRGTVVSEGSADRPVWAKLVVPVVWARSVVLAASGV